MPENLQLVDTSFRGEHDAIKGEGNVNWILCWRTKSLQHFAFCVQMLQMPLQMVQRGSNPKRFTHNKLPLGI